MRIFLAFCAVCAGLGASALSFMWNISTLAPAERGVPGHQTWAEKEVIFEACVTFYGVTYWTARLLNQLIGAHEDAAQFQQWSKGHMGLLHVFGGILFVVVGITALVQDGVVKPSILLGILFIGAAIRDRRAVLGFANAGQTLWRGRGLLALAAGLVPFASCAGLMEWHAVAAMFFGALIWIAAGITCWRWGRKWDNGLERHELLRISLANWGRFYVVMGVLISVLLIAGLVRKALAAS